MPRIRLTTVTVEKLRPPTTGRRIEYFDTLLPSFGVRVSLSGIKSWVVFCRQNGSQRRLTLGRYPALSLADARELARNVLQKVAAGSNPMPVVRSEADEMGCLELAVVAREFIEKYAIPNTKSWRETQRVLEKDILPVLGRHKLGQVTRRDVNMLIDAVVERGAPVQANHVFGTVRKIFIWAIERGYLETSPMAGMRAPTKVQSRDRVLTDNELRAVWSAGDTLGFPFGCLAQLLVLTGQRIGEVTHMRWSDIDVDTATWIIPGSANKSGRRHEVPLSDMALDIICRIRRLDNCPFVFTTNGRTAVSGFSRAKQNLDKTSGVFDWRYHDLRRTAASGMARLGVPVPAISKILNHSSPSAYDGITATYNKYSYDSEKREAVVLWSQHVSGLLADDSQAIMSERLRIVA